MKVSISLSHFFVFLLVTMAGLQFGCGGGGGSRVTPEPSTITLSPTTSTATTGGYVVFTVSLTGRVSGGGYNLTLVEENAGTINGTTYFPGNTPGNYHIVGTSTMDPSVVAEASVTVTQGVTSPSGELYVMAIGAGAPPYSLGAGKTCRFFLYGYQGIAVPGGGFPPVDFTVEESSGGSIAVDPSNPNRGAIYTAPGAPGVYHIKCAFRSNPAIAKTLAITIVSL